MPLQKQAINIPFGQGLDTKTDPNQVQLGKFLSLSNAMFNNAGLLQKRNGFGVFPSSPNADTTTLALQNSNLIAIGNSFQSYAPTTQQWITKGDFQEVTLEVDHLVRSTNSQSACDTAVGPNNAACTAYLDSDGNYYYTVSDASTGEVLVQPVQLPTGATIARVAVLGNSFIVTYYYLDGVVKKLRYIAVPVYTPESPLAPADLALDVNDFDEGYDILSANSSLYFAYSSSFSGGTVRISYLDPQLFTHIFRTVTGHTASLVSLSSDTTNNNVYLTFCDVDVFTTVYDQELNPVNSGAVFTVLSGYTVNHLATAAYAGVNNIFYQITNTYSYSTVRTDYILYNTVTESGTVTSVNTDGLIRSVGLASKAFIYNTSAYVLVNYGGALQPTYFLINQTGKIVSKLAYGNGMQYAVTQVLPSFNLGVTKGITTASVSYLFKDLLAPVNKNLNSNSQSNIYTQTGINIVKFYFNDGAITTTDVAGSLHVTGGFMWQYDGNVPVEHGFFVYPEDLGYTSGVTGGALKAQLYYYKVTYEWTDADGNLHRSSPSLPLEVDLTNVTPTPLQTDADFASGSTTLTVVDVTGFAVGQVITGTGIQPNTHITAIDTIASTFTIDIPTSTSGSTIQITTLDTLLVTLDIPTLRLTYKLAPNSVRIVIYRWSLDQQNFYQITLIPTPIVNDPTIDSISYVDALNDDVIVGNLLIYTSGGVYENIGAPACQFSTLYRARLWFVDAENPNTVWYSKPIVQATPVEFTDLQTIFVTPTIGVQGSTGPITALASMDDKLVIFKENAIYYLNGNGPDITGANNDYSDPILINSTVGCTNQNSIVFTPAGLMFQSAKGIWVLGRDLGTNYIGAPVEAYNNSLVVSAVSVPDTNQIRLALANNIMLMYDYYYNQWGTFSNLNSRSGIVYANKHTFISSFGQVFQETIGQYLDGSRPVLMSFTTAWAKLADLQGYQRSYFFYLLGTYKSPHTLSINVAFDYDPSPVQNSQILPVNFNPAYGGDSPYGNQPVYGGPSAVEQWRVFLANQRCQSMQISLQENFDPSYGTVAGAGLTLSGINFVMGVKRGYTTLKPSLSVG